MLNYFELSVCKGITFFNIMPMIFVQIMEFPFNNHTSTALSI